VIEPLTWVEVRTAAKRSGCVAIVLLAFGLMPACVEAVAINVSHR